MIGVRSWNVCVVPVVVAVTAVTFSTQPTHALFGIPSFLEFGTCAQVRLKENFDPVKYSGLWFDIHSVPNEYQHTKKCVTQNYTWTGTQMNVATRGLTDDDVKVQQSAVMVQDEEHDSPAAMLVQAAGVPEAPYQVISTDYSTFSCVYSCLDGYAGFMAEFMWVFSRTPTLSDNKIKHCYDTFTSMATNPKKMVPVMQEHMCPYYERLDKLLTINKKHILKVLGGEAVGTTAAEEEEEEKSPPPPPALLSTMQSSLPTHHSEMIQNEIQGGSIDDEHESLDMKHDRESSLKHKEVLKEGSVKRTNYNPANSDKGHSGSSGRRTLEQAAAPAAPAARHNTSSSSSSTSTTLTTTLLILIFASLESLLLLYPLI